MSDDRDLLAAPTLPSPLPKILEAGSLNLLAGSSGIGKTALLSWMLRQFQDGAPIFGHAVNRPPAIGYLSADRPWHGNRHWFDASGCTQLTVYSLVNDRGQKLPNQRMKHLRVAFFKELVEKMALPPGSLLVVDPIALFLGGNLLDYDTCAFACIEIERWLLEPDRQYCILGVCHTSKQKTDKGERYLRLQDRINGSGAQLGYTGTQLVLASPEETGDDEDRYTFLWNPHGAKQEVFQFLKGENGLFLTQAATTLTAGSATPSDLSPFETEVFNQFPLDGSPVASAHIYTLYADLGETGKRRITRALHALEGRKMIRQIRRGSWARLPVDPYA